MPEPTMNSRLDVLLSRAADETATVEEWRELEALLAGDPAARRRYVQMADLHSELQARHARSTSSETPQSHRQSRGRFPWLSWRPLTAAAAGIAFGIFGASMVWAYALPMANRTAERTISVLTEGFEKAAPTPSRGFPRQANEWSGDLSAPVTAESGVVPVEGDRMARLEQASPKLRRFSYAWRILDLAELPGPSEGESRKLEVSAAFNTPGEARPLRYQIRLAAFSQEPGEVRRIWNNEPVLFDTVLQHVGRNVRVEADDPGWQAVHASMEIPPGTRSVLISLAASEADPASAPREHYLDDVQARFVVSSTFKN